MKISIDMKISDLVKEFRAHYGLNIEIYKPKNKTDSTTLLEISPDQKSGEFFNIRGNTKVSDIEDMFFDKFGIDAQVKNKDGSMTDSDLTIYKIINSVKGFSLVNEDDEDNLTTKKKKVEVKKENHKKENLEDIENEESTKKKKIDAKKKEIDTLYIKYQKNENYKCMTRLLSSIEETKISYILSKELNSHVYNIMNKANNISNLSIRKRKFFLIILAAIIFTVFITGVTILMLDTINNKAILKEVKSIANGIEELKIEHNTLMTKGDIIKASSIKISIEEEIEKMNNTKSEITEKNMNIYLIISFIGILLLAVEVIKLNRYIITSTRLFK